MVNYYAFSSVSRSQTNGYSCICNDKEESKLFVYDCSSIKIWFDRIIELDIVLVVADSRDFYRNFLFLGKEFLSHIKIFDCKAFLHNYKNLKNVDVYSIILKNYQIDINSEIDRFNKIWKIQGEKNWNRIPQDLLFVYLQKETLGIQKLINSLKKVHIDDQLKSYNNFFQEFLLYLVSLEETGIIDKNNNRIVPQYEYDRIVTGRIVNIKPFCYQTVYVNKILNDYSYKSRFDDNGIFLIADWKNTDFRISAALSKQSVKDRLKDPYLVYAKNVLHKNSITEEERDEIKQKILKDLYSSEESSFFDDYPDISNFKEKIILEAKQTKKITTYFGKSRYFVENDKFETKAFSCINQMTVADLCKKAIIEMQKEFEENKLESVPIPIVIYDSFTFDVKRDELEKVILSIRKSLIERTIPDEFRFYVDFEVKISDLQGNIY